MRGHQRAAASWSRRSRHGPQLKPAAGIATAWRYRRDEAIECPQPAPGRCLGAPGLADTVEDAPWVPSVRDGIVLSDEQIPMLCDIGASIAFDDDKHGEVEKLIILLKDATCTS
jgi:hypothetical protein